MEIDEIRYSLCKQLYCDDAFMEISTNYGSVPLQPEDIVAVRRLLRKRLEKRLRKLEAQA